MFEMTAAERQQFLAGLHVGVLSVAEPGRRVPLAVPIWYTYQPGGQVSVITGRDTRKARAIRAAGWFGLCAQDEQPPYKYVTAEGPAEIEETDPAERLAMARRYLGEQGGDAYLAANPDPDGQMIAIRMTPRAWRSVDYGKG
jgi:nitroimidazol reductase NimA-like FMN-containing flavoprotein (pyridoxamine 5'-phosphate oxidase superfamily)